MAHTLTIVRSCYVKNLCKLLPGKTVARLARVVHAQRGIVADFVSDKFETKCAMQTEPKRRGAARRVRVTHHVAPKCGGNPREVRISAPCTPLCKCVHIGVLLQSIRCVRGVFAEAKLEVLLVRGVNQLVCPRHCRMMRRIGQHDALVFAVFFQSWWQGANRCWHRDK